ncbi:hypothetical protein FNJ87_01340 [Nonlabens mediterrranea]|uniref:Transcriptional regulator n=1 Tax=Nonlabens mediterrranea TaxID=1419947 RepID=A0ABS0A121_9FLAO|nr:hypothetical protein [Nonlabens mediterrranea]
MKKLNINFVAMQRYAFNKIAQCKHIGSKEVALYYSLLGYWNKFWFPELLSIRREDLLNYSKIGSVNTYLKAMRNLDKHGFIKYLPSKNANVGSKVKFCVDKSIVCQNLINDGYTDDKRLIPLLNNSKLEQINQTPEKKEVLEYFISNSSTKELAERFFNHNESLGWKSNGQLIVNWKPFANNYMKNDKARKVTGSSRMKRQGSSQFDSGNFKTLGHE